MSVDKIVLDDGATAVVAVSGAAVAAVQVRADGVTVQSLDTRVQSSTVTAPGTRYVSVNAPRDSGGITPGGGTAIGGALRYVQATAAAQWHWTHTLGRRPTVAVYVGGELVEADVDVSTTDFTVTFLMPLAGEAIIT